MDATPDRPWTRSYAPGVPATIAEQTGSLVDLLTDAARRLGPRVALDFFGATTTYAELDAQVARAAEALRRLGVQRGPLSETGRLRLARCVVEDGWPLRRAAERFQVSPATAKRWADRYRAEGPAGMVDRSSRPHRSPRRTPAPVERKVRHLRAKRRWGPAHRLAGSVRRRSPRTPRTTMRYDRARKNLDRHPDYILAALHGLRDIASARGSADERKL